MQVRQTTLLQKQESGQARALLNGLWAECEAKQLTQKQLSGVIKAVLRQSPKAELGEEADSVVLIDDLPVFSFIEADSSWDVRSHNVEKLFADVC